ncbi:MAG: hypothetical protein CMN72_05345 [Sphingomonas sp.]|nr:hypothetical protein [Sphingomonas sp.]|tara:strand:+ start:67 stop:363 length:297 start_codon:yes stop_codon:yes gene_type:complete
MANTPTSPDTTPDPATNSSDTQDAVSKKAKKSARATKEKVSRTAHDASAAAKKRPYAAVALATGALAAIGGAAFGIFRVTGKKKEDARKPPHVKPSAT